MDERRLTWWMEGEARGKRGAWKLSGVGGRPCKDVLLYFLFVPGRPVFAVAVSPCCRARPSNQTHPTRPANKATASRRITRQQPARRTKSCVTLHRASPRLATRRVANCSLACCYATPRKHPESKCEFSFEFFHISLLRNVERRNKLPPSEVAG